MKQLIVIAFLLFGCSSKEIDTTDRLPASEMMSNADSQSCQTLMGEHILFKFKGNLFASISEYIGLLQIGDNKRVRYSSNWGSDKIVDSDSLNRCYGSYNICKNHISEIKNFIDRDVMQFLKKTVSGDAEKLLMMRDCAFLMMDEHLNSIFPEQSGNIK